MPVDSHSGFKKVLLFILAIVILVPLYVYVSNPLMVTVNGVGDVSLTPDLASVAFVVSDQGATSEAVKTGVEGRAKALESILLGFGAKREDIVRSQVTVAPTGSTDTAKRFSATISMGGKISDITKASSLVAALYGNGAIYVSQPILASQDSAALEVEAYNKAILEADKEASRIAIQNLKFLKKRVSIVQATSGGAGTITGVGEVGGTTSTEANILKITKNVTVTYKMW
jgi:uncharacterized protein